NVSCASLIANAVWTQALVGMHPTRRQVPPSASSFSMQTAFAPSCAARIAAVYPPGPPPRTATSQSISLSRIRFGFRGDPSGGQGASGEIGAHDERAAALRDLRKAVPLVEVKRRVVGLHAQADRSEALLPRVLEQRSQELVPVAPPAAARHHGDRQLRRFLVDEPVTRLGGAEQPVPGGRDLVEVLEQDQGEITAPPPPLDVAQDRQVVVVPPACVVGMTKHVPQEGDVG